MKTPPSAAGRVTAVITPTCKLSDMNGIGKTMKKITHFFQIVARWYDNFLLELCGFVRCNYGFTKA